MKLILMLLLCVNIFANKYINNLMYTKNSYIVKTKTEYIDFINNNHIKYVNISEIRGESLGEYELYKNRYIKYETCGVQSCRSDMHLRVFHFNTPVRIDALRYDFELESIKNEEINLNNIDKIFKQYFNSRDETTLYKNNLYNKIENYNLNTSANEYIIYISTNEQILHILKTNNSNGYTYVGNDKVSTGEGNFLIPATARTKKQRYFKTPKMVINRQNLSKHDWRALGTSKKGYGDYNDKIFFLGVYDKDSNGKPREIHLAMHTTNAIRHKALGTKASQGCIRISKKMNVLLKKSKIIDGVYGKYVIID